VRRLFRPRLARHPIILCAALLCVASVALADGAPWRARRTPGLRPNYIATARIAPTDWPAEPASPESIDAPRLAAALPRLCGWMPPGRPLRYAEWMIRYGREFGEDPFLLGALAYRRTDGSCRPDFEGPRGELGLTQIRRETYADHLRRGEYRYHVRERGVWNERVRRMDRFPFAGPRIARAEENLYFAAALLSAWRDQHASVDAAFEQRPHRHYVSHFVWGDRVRSDRDEDQILTDRRRLLFYYGAIPAARPIQRFGLELGAPLDGAPRVISSGLGDDRDGGGRSHRGIDVESLPGEPIRAIADGRVVFAGVDLPGNASHEQVARDGYDAYPRASLGRGGRYACIRHVRSDGPDLRSCYMHMETVEVEYGTELHRGDLVGTVGRTGMQSSAAHLHLEVYLGEELLDGSDVLGGLLLGDPSAEPEY
jgi:murein DD-endopeptidase MepM/ murein hydrolase activator NlpD